LDMSLSRQSLALVLTTEQAGENTSIKDKKEPKNKLTYMSKTCKTYKMP